MLQRESAAPCGTMGQGNAWLLAPWMVPEFTVGMSSLSKLTPPFPPVAFPMPKKRPFRKDENETAYALVQAIIGEGPRPEPPREREKNPEAVDRGRAGGKKGGRSMRRCSSDTSERGSGISDGVIGTLRDPSLPPKTARYPAEWTRSLMRQAGWWPSNGRCYLTCYRLCGDPALGRSFRYVEGWVWNPAAPTAVPHAWLEDTDGRILDPTPCWRDTPDAAYLGVIALTVLELLVAQDAHQQPPSLSAGPDLWDASTPLGRHVGTGRQYALWRTTGRSMPGVLASVQVLLADT